MASTPNHATPASTAHPQATGGDAPASKAYQPSSVEPRMRQKWDAAAAFTTHPGRVLSGEAKPYCILIPPPNVTGVLHLGHALNNTLQDILTRAHRMMGFETLWMPGTDHAGIATQAVVERRLMKEQGKKRKDYTREQFVALVQEWKDEYEQRITAQLKAMGCSCDFSRQRFTMDEICARAVREAFFRLFQDGLIYRGKRLVNWDPALQTAVADDECYEEEIDTNFWYLKYPLATPVRLPDGTMADSVTVATTRPETYLGDTAVALNPKDPRAAALVGKTVILPLVGREIPIVADDYVVLPESMASTDEERNDPKAKYATGFLKVTPAHDQNDADLASRQSPPLPAINMMSPDGKVSDQHGWTDTGEAKQFVGLSMADARKRVVEEFKARGLLVETRAYRQNVTRSDRSKAIIEPYLSDQWFVKVTDDRLRGAANRALVAEQRSDEKTAPRQNAQPNNNGDGSLRFYPARYAKMYEQWHDNIRDWCISRQLWWGHRIPVWSRAFANPAEAAALMRLLSGMMLGDDAPSCVTTSTTPESTLVHVCVRDPMFAKVVEGFGFTQDQDVLDTWFSSALWPLSTLGWPDPMQSEQTAGLLEAFNPTSVLSTAREIITLWVSRMVMMNRYLLGEGQGRGPVPFRDVFIHAVVQDGDGKRMSKSAGNGVDPLDIIETHGADAMRFTLAQMTTNTQDVRMPVKPDPKTGKNTSDKFDSGRSFCNKLWNASTGVAIARLSREPVSIGVSTPAGRLLVDRWMLSRLARAVAACEACLKNYEFAEYVQTLYQLLWWDLCDWYLEAIKPTVDASPEQKAVLRTTLDAILRLLHPVIPFVTEAIFEQLAKLPTGAVQGVTLAPAPNGLLCLAAWPKVDSSLIDENAEREFETVRELVNAIRNVRSEHQVSPKRRITLHVSAALGATLSRVSVLIETLANVEAIVTTQPASGAPAVAMRALGEEMFLSNLADAIDAGAEKDRLSKQLEQLRKSAGAISGRLNNPGYVDKAPPKLVEESKAQLAKLQGEIAAIESKLASIK